MCGINDPVTGLVRFGLRGYDPGIGRWTARDPVLFAGGQANLYTYVANNPVSRVDPAGLAPEEWTTLVEHYERESLKPLTKIKASLITGVGAKIAGAKTAELPLGALATAVKCTWKAKGIGPAVAQAGGWKVVGGLR